MDVPQDRNAARFEWCEIRRWRGYLTSTFYAETATEEVLAESEPFRWYKSVPPPETPGVRAAYDAVVAAVCADGWTITDEATGAWYETRFKRPNRTPLPVSAVPPAVHATPVAAPPELAPAPPSRERETPAPPTLLPPAPTRFDPRSTWQRGQRRLSVANGALALVAPEQSSASEAVFEPAAQPVPLPETPLQNALRLAEVEAELTATRRELDAFRSRIGEVERERDEARRLAVEASERVLALEHDLELAKDEREEPSNQGEVGALPEKPVAVPDAVWLRLAEVGARLKTATEQAAVLERTRDVLAEANEQLASELAEQTRRGNELEAELARARQDEGASPVEPVDHHLALVGSPTGYLLVECSGPPPLVDTIVELPDESGIRGRHRIVRVGKANLPGVDSRCVYLLPVD